ncbi:glycosyltransferase family 9 protein [bacterium]|nr:glycosyltransferase family 9 protein [bacterium]
MNLLSEPIHRILIVRLDEIGDMVLTIPVLRELRRNFPNAHITLLLKPENENLMKTCPYVNKILVFNWRTTHARLKAKLYSLLRLWGCYDLVLVPRWDVDYYEAGTLANYTGARFRVSYSQGVSERKNRMNPVFDKCFTHLLEFGDAKHEVEKNLNVLAALGCRVESDQLELWLTLEDELFASEILSGSETAFIALGVGAGDSRRIWPIENFIELSRRIRERYQVEFIVIGGKSDAALGDQLKSEIGGVIHNIAGRATLRQTAAVLKRCCLLIGNDAGPMHLAAANGIPIIEISCHPQHGLMNHFNSPARFGPWGVTSIILQPENGIDLCTDECELNEPHCIRGVSVDRVEQAVRQMLSRETAPKIKNE